MKVPYFDLKQQYLGFREELLDALDRVCRNASFIQGEEVARFEEEFAAYCEAKHCVAVNSGTSAIHLCLLAAGIGVGAIQAKSASRFAGDEVITTANSFIATAEAISYTGATPVFADIDPATGNLDPSAVEAAITPRTKAVMPVHLYGRPADMDRFREICARHNLTLIEDACQSHGARYRGKRVGALAFAGAFSFYPGKNLGAYGEGGALVTNDDEVAKLTRQLRDHGQTSRYYHGHVGYNYRMDGFQGAVLRVKMKRLEQWTARRRQICATYKKLLAGARLETPQDCAFAESVNHLFVVWVEERDRVRQELEARGVQTAIHYPVPIHLQQAYAALGYRAGSLPHTERACERAISMPLYPEMPDEHVEYAAAALKEIVGNR
jgi:dTDP-4-amino-4,6-dideoxygalactose transaminase